MNIFGFSVKTVLSSSCLIYLELVVLIAALVTLIAALVAVLTTALVATLLIPGVLLTAKVKHVIHANIVVRADLAFTLGTCTLTRAIVMPLVGKMLFEVFFDGPVTRVPIKE